MGTINALIPILVPLGSFAMVFGVVYVVVSARHRERLAMIESGADPSLFESKKTGSAVLKWGLFLIGIALGIFLGYIFEEYAGMDGDVSYPAMIFLFGGLSLLAAYMIQKKQLEKEDQQR